MTDPQPRRENNGDRHLKHHHGDKNRTSSGFHPVALPISSSSRALLLSTSGYYGSSFHMQNCMTGPILSSALFGTLFAGMDAMQGAHQFTPRVVVQYSGFLYVYNIMQCPMEAIHGRPSLIHNALSAGTLGYIGVQSGRLGIPFVNPYALMGAFGGSISPSAIGFVVYGAMGAAFGALGGKQM